MKIVPFRDRSVANVLLSMILGAGSIALAAIAWLVVAGGGEYLILQIVAAALLSVVGFMSLMSLITGKPWYLEVLVAAALLHF